MFNSSTQGKLSRHIKSMVIATMFFALCVGAVCIKNDYGVKDVTSYLPWSHAEEPQPSAAEKERAEIIKRVVVLEEQQQTLKAEKELYEAKLALLEKEYSRLGTKVSRLDKIQIAQYQVLSKQIHYLNHNIKSLDVTLTSWRNASKGSELRTAEYTTSRPRTTEEAPKENAAPLVNLPQVGNGEAQEAIPTLTR